MGEREEGEGGRRKGSEVINTLQIAEQDQEMMDQKVSSVFVLFKVARRIEMRLDKDGKKDRDKKGVAERRLHNIYWQKINNVRVINTIGRCCLDPPELALNLY